LRALNRKLVSLVCKACLVPETAFPKVPCQDASQASSLIRAQKQISDVDETNSLSIIYFITDNIYFRFYVACEDTIGYVEPVTGHTCQSYVDYGFCVGNSIVNIAAVNAPLARQNCVACGKCMYTSVQIIVFLSQFLLRRCSYDHYSNNNNNNANTKHNHINAIPDTATIRNNNDT
jgi:hypothetical protein